MLVAASVLRRDELESVVRANSQFRLVGAVLGMSAVTMRTRALRPDVVLFDLPDPQSAFPALAADLEQAGAAVVVLVEEPDTNWVAHAVRSGVRALLPRDASHPDIHSAIEVAHRGMLLLDPELAQGLLTPRVKVHSSENAPAMMEDLTPREVEILRMMAEGLGNKEIAARLSISDHTVKFHISSILAKLGASTRTEAVTTGIRMGLVLL